MTPKYVELSAVQQKIMEMIGDIRGTYLAKDIGEMSPADVQEVKHAKWIYRGEDAVCSNCGQLTEDYCIEGDNESGYYTVLPHYCSNCGAKMDLED